MENVKVVGVVLPVVIEEKVLEASEKGMVYNIFYLYY